MAAKTVRSRAGGAVRLVAALAGLAAPPTLLWVTIGNPLPTWPIDWAHVVEAIQVGLIPTFVWVNVLAVAAWIAWAVLVGMLAVEVVAVARNRPSAAGVPGIIRHLAQILVAAAIALASPAQHAMAIGGDGPPVAVAAAPAPHPGEEGLPVEAQPVADGRLVTVAEGDSWGGFAADVLGDPSLGPQLRAANLGRAVGDGHTITEGTPFVEPGWQLLIPSHLGPATGDVSTVPDAAAVDRVVEVEEVADAVDNVGAEEAEQDTREVVSGDHFWGIARTTLADVLGRPPTDAEIVPYWRQLIDANRDRLLPPHDPDLIYPGQQLLVPPPPNADQLEAPNVRQPAPASSDVNAHDIAPHRNHAAPEQDAAERNPDGDRASDAGIGDGQPSRWQDAIERVVPPTSEGRPDRGAERRPDMAQRPDARRDEEQTAWGSAAGLVPGLAAMAVAAAGVVALVRRRRRAALQRRPCGLRLPTPAPEVSAEMTRLEVAAADEEPLEDLVALLCSIPEGVTPPLVVLDDHGGVRLLFGDGQLPDPPAPWTLAYDDSRRAVGWRAQLGAVGPARSIGLPLLVTLGRLGDEETVLANVGAIGHLQVVGSTDEVRRRLRAATLEVATSRVAGPVEVAVAGDRLLAEVDQVTLVDHLDGEVAASIEERDANIIVEDRTARLLVCHEGVEPPELPDGMAAMVGLLAAGGTPQPGWRLEITSEETARLQLPDGGQVSLTLPQLDPQLVAGELHRLAQTVPVEPAEASDTPEAAPEPATILEPAADPAANGRLQHPAAASAPGTDDPALVPIAPGPVEPAWCEVRLLGPIEVVRDGTPVEGLTPQLMELLVCLVTSRDGLTVFQLEDMVWGGQVSANGTGRIRTALGKLRDMLGDGPDGQPLLPRRDGQTSRVRLSKHVGTDLDRAQAHLAVARELPEPDRYREQLAALKLVRGRPLEDLTVSWSTHIEQKAITVLQEAALAVAETCRELEEFDVAATAIEQGLLLCDPADQLYVEWARVERERGRPEQVPRIRQLLHRRYGEHADEVAVWVATPAPETEQAFQQLMFPINVNHRSDGVGLP